MNQKKCGIYQTFPAKENFIEGGRRLKGEYKQGNKDYPLITYITVVYNRVNTLQQCMESVLNQDYPNIEYIVIDGASLISSVLGLKANPQTANVLPLRLPL